MMLCSVASQSCPVLATSPSGTKCCTSTLYVKSCPGARTTMVSVFKIQGLNSAHGSCISLGGAADDFSRRLWLFLIPGPISTHSLTLVAPSVAGLHQPAAEQNQLTSYSGLTICCCVSNPLVQVSAIQHFSFFLSLPSLLPSPSLSMY